MPRQPKPEPKPYTWLPDAPVGTTQVRYLDRSDNTEKVRFEVEAGTTISFFTATGQIEARIDLRGQLHINTGFGWLIVVPTSTNSVTVERRP